MKKIILVLFLLLLLTGCKNKETAGEVVSTYLNSYIDFDDNVKSNLNKIIKEEINLNNEAKNIYKKTVIKQYKDLKYSILREEYDNDKALVTVNVNVYNLCDAEEEVTNYLAKNLKDFYNENNEFDNDKYILYKLNYLYNYDKRVNYSIVFFLTYKNHKWVLTQPTDSDLEKIHGIYKEQ